MSRSSKANRYGTLAEQAAADRHDLVRKGVHTSWCDAKDGEGRPVEIKSAMVERADGSTGRFRVFREPHRRLVKESGLYVFVAYKPRGRGIRVKDMRKLRARNLPGAGWYGAGGHRGTEQRKLAISTVFD